MSFSKSCRNPRLEGKSILKAECQTISGDWKESSFDLDLIIGNMNGVLVWGLKDFSKSTSGSAVVGHFLFGGVPFTSEGKLPSLDKFNQPFDLDGMIVNNDGKLQAVNVPAIVAIPNGPLTTQALDQFHNALKNNPNAKVHVADNKDGSQLWYVHAGGHTGFEEKTFIKVADVEVKASMLHIVKDTGHAIENVNVDIISASAGAQVQYLSVGNKAYATYLGVDAKVNLFRAEASIFNLELGLGLETGAGIKNGSLDVHVAGCGLTFGKVVSISAWGSSIAIDFGKLFGF